MRMPNNTGSGPHFRANGSLKTNASMPIAIGAVTTYSSPALPQGITKGRFIEGNFLRRRHADRTVNTVTSARSQTYTVSNCASVWNASSA